MARWRAAAIERLPELRSEIAAAEDIWQLWLELESRFEKAYREPRDEVLIAGIYAYADWCVQAPRVRDVGHDPFTAVALAFYEDIPTNRAARDDMPRWFRYEEVAGSKQTFAYLIGEAAFKDLLKYLHERQDRYVVRDRQGEL